MMPKHDVPKTRKITVLSQKHHNNVSLIIQQNHHFRFIWAAVNMNTNMRKILNKSLDVPNELNVEISLTALES